jgi:hypothetical protein
MGLNPVKYFGIKKSYNQKEAIASLDLVIFSPARVVGIEPTLEVLETPVLPLYDTRNHQVFKPYKLC